MRWSLKIAHDSIEHRLDKDLTRLVLTVFGDDLATTLIIVATLDEDGKPALTIGLPEQFSHLDFDARHP